MAIRKNPYLRAAAVLNRQNIVGAVDKQVVQAYFQKAATNAEAPSWIILLSARALARHFNQLGIQEMGTATYVAHGILNDHTQLWGGNKNVALGALAIAERLGFRLDTHKDTMSMFRKLRQALAKHMYSLPTDSGPEVLEQLNEGIDKNLVESTLTWISRWREALQVMTLLAISDSEDAEQGDEDTPDLYVPIHLPALCVDLFMSLDLVQRLTDTVEVGINDGGTDCVLTYSMHHVWVVLQELAHMGVQEQMIRKFVDRHDLHVLLWISEFYGNVIDRSVFTQFAMRPHIIHDLSREQIADLVREWKSLDEKVRLDKFAKFGTAEAYLASLPCRPTPAWEDKDEDTEEILPHLVGFRSAPPEPEPQLVPDGLDWDWIMAELMVEDLLPDLDPRLTRILIVHGLLRQGDRMSFMNRLPSRDRKRIWKQCRDAGCDSSELDSIRDELEACGLIVRKDNKYSLASQVSVSNELHVLHDRIRALSEKYAE